MFPVPYFQEPAVKTSQSIFASTPQPLPESPTPIALSYLPFLPSLHSSSSRRREGDAAERGPWLSRDLVPPDEDRLFRASEMEVPLCVSRSGLLTESPSRRRQFSISLGRIQWFLFSLPSSCGAHHCRSLSNTNTRSCPCFVSNSNTGKTTRGGHLCQNLS